MYQTAGLRLWAVTPLVQGRPTRGPGTIRHTIRTPNALERDYPPAAAVASERPSNAVRGLILIVGPDGCGKSAVAAEMAALARANRVSLAHGHYRPGLLGRWGRTILAPVERPHADEPRSLAAGAAKLLAVFADWMIGYAFVWRRARRQGLLVIERGWFDMVVDPRRYRLQPQLTGMVLALGRLLPPADLVVLLTGPAAMVHSRKPEIGESEIRRQMREWPVVARRAGQRLVQIDAGGAPADQIADRIWKEMGTAGVDRRWRKVPFGPARLELHVWGRVPPPAWIHHSYRLTPRMLDPLRPTLASLGRRRQVEDPLLALPGLCAELGFHPTGFLAMRSSTPERWIVGMSEGSRLSAVFKIGPPCDRLLQSEAEVLGVLRHDAEMAAVPGLLWSGEHDGFYVLATEAIAVRRHGRPTLVQIRDLCTDLVRGSGMRPPLVHGDLAPWNVTLCHSGMGVFDWEHALWQRRPLWDLAHYLIQSGALLHTYTPATVVRLLTATGSPGWVHLADCDVDPARAPQLLARYLDTAPPFARSSSAFRAGVARCLAL